MRCKKLPFTSASCSLEALELVPANTPFSCACNPVETWRISAGHWRSLSARPGDVIVASEGVLWLTMADDPVDYILRPGEAQALEADALTVVGPLHDEPVRLQLHRLVYRPFAQSSGEVEATDRSAQLGRRRQDV